MKIVKTTDTSLNIIPREYPSDVSVSIRGESTNTTTTFETPVTTSGGYLNVPYTFNFIENNFYELEVNTITQSGGVKCIAANNEYLSSPIGNYFGNTISGLDVEIEISGITDPVTRIFGQGAFNISMAGAERIRVNITDDLGVAQSFNYDTNGVFTGGNIKLKGNVANLDMYIDDVLLVPVYVLINQNISLTADYELYFSTFLGVLSYDSTINYIKIGNHEWTSENWEAPTTINSQGVITTLHSNVSTDDMVIQEQVGTRIYKDKIFCTDQDNYSINDGKYKERSVQREYITR